MSVRVFAPAKINLTLRVGAPHGDGLHPLQSVVMFADVGDWIEASLAPDLSLSIRGEFAAPLRGEEDNLVLRAARAMVAEAGIPAPGARLVLEKNLPVASGMGGGSSDAAAALKALNKLWNLRLTEDVLTRIAAGIGADAPVCVGARAAWMTGVGDEVTSLRTPALAAVLVNPLKPLTTASVFGEFDRVQRGKSLADETPPYWSSQRDMIEWISGAGNDLMEAAQSLMPDIALIERALERDARVLFAGLSGSGATMFALVANEATAIALSRDIAATHPEWWVRATTLGAP